MGWATQGGRTLVFARLIQDEDKGQNPAGVRARDSLMDDIPELAKKFEMRNSPRTISVPR